jgi:hypothetical protein
MFSFHPLLLFASFIHLSEEKIEGKEKKIFPEMEILSPYSSSLTSGGQK